MSFLRMATKGCVVFATILALCTQFKVLNGFEIFKIQAKSAVESSLPYKTKIYGEKQPTKAGKWLRDAATRLFGGAGARVFFATRTEDRKLGEQILESTPIPETPISETKLKTMSEGEIADAVLVARKFVTRPQYFAERINYPPQSQSKQILEATPISETQTKTTSEAEQDKFTNVDKMSTGAEDSSIDPVLSSYLELVTFDTEKKLPVEIGGIDVPKAKSKKDENSVETKTMEVQIEKTEGVLGLSFDQVDKDITVYSIADSALPEVKEKLQKGDIIISVNGIKYATNADVAKGIRDISVGETVTFTIFSREKEALETQSEEPVTEPFIAEVENEIGIEESVPEISTESDIKIKSEAPVEEPFIGEVEIEIGIEESVPETSAESDIKTQSEEPVAEPLIAEVENEIGIEEIVLETTAESDIKVQAVAEPVVDTVKEVTHEAEIKSEEPVADNSDFQTQSEEPVAEPFIAEIGIEERLQKSFAESDIEPSCPMKLTITKSSDRLGITFHTEEGVIKVYDINANAVESVAKNFQVGDIVLAMNGLKYSHDAKLASPIREMEIGEMMIFDILRVPQ